jgi:sulfofructose kinase
MARILVCGMITADFVFNVSAMPKRAEKHIAETAQMILGGGAANAAIAIARQQGSASLAGRIGDDWMGKAITQILDDENIDRSFLQVSDGATTSFSSVMVDDAGERQIVNFRGDGFNKQTHWLTQDKPPQFYSPDHNDQHFDAVLADTRWTDAAVALLNMARDANVPGVVDAEAPVSDSILACASHVAFSKQGLTEYTAIADTNEAILAADKKLRAWVCVTDGNNGVYHIKDGEIVNTPTHRVEAIDTLAAGDVWHGVFTLGLSEGLDEQHAIDYANAAAALKCTAYGGALASPTREQTLTFMKQAL